MNDDPPVTGIRPPEVRDAGPGAPVRYTLLFPERVHASASPVCDMVEVLRVPGTSDADPGEPAWGLAVQGEPLGEPIAFDQLPLAVQEAVTRLLPGDLGDPASAPDVDGASPHRR